jgi:hypothetical protein
MMSADRDEPICCAWCGFEGTGEALFDHLWDEHDGTTCLCVDEKGEVYWPRREWIKSKEPPRHILQMFPAGRPPPDGWALWRRLTTLH